MEENKPNFHNKPIKNSNTYEQAFNVYLNDFLVAEVRGNDPTNATVIPMRELNDYEEDKLHEYIESILTEGDY